MAEFGKNIFGDVNGKLGDFVFRKINGKTFVSLRPTKYKQTDSIKLKTVRTAFSILSTFSAYINSITELKKVWSLKQINGKRAYNKIYSHNSVFIKQIDNYSILNILPINNKFNLFFDNLSINNYQISFNIRCLNLEWLIPNNNFTFIIVGGNAIGRKYAHQISSLDVNDIMENKTVLFNLNESIIKLEEIDILFCGITISDDQNKILSWSNTKSILNYYK